MVMTPILGISNLIGSLFMFCYDPIDPLFLQKNLVCLYPEILGPKVGLFFTKMYHLTNFNHFVSIFSLIFDPIDPLFY